MLPTSADVGAFLVADPFAAMRAGRSLWQELDIISSEKGHISLTQKKKLSLTVIPSFLLLVKF